MSSKNIFEEFDKLKIELEEKLKKIKDIQTEIKDSLQQNKDNKILFKNIDDMKNSINNLKTQVLNNIDSSFKSVIEKAKNINSNEIKEIQNQIVNIQQSSKKEDS